MQNDQSKNGQPVSVGSTGGSAFAGHTPGPWVLDYDKGSTQDILSLKHGGICTVRRAGRHDNATFAANARLIAAAPEMLRVVQLARDAVEAGAIDECYLSLLRDAIAALPNIQSEPRPGDARSL